MCNIYIICNQYQKFSEIDLEYFGNIIRVFSDRKFGNFENRKIIPIPFQNFSEFGILKFRIQYYLLKSKIFKSESEFLFQWHPYSRCILDYDFILFLK